MRNLIPKNWRLNSRHTQTLIVVVATIALVIFLTSWRIIFGNGVTLHVVPEDQYAFVIVDGDIKGITKQAKESITMTLSGGQHQILSSKENSWPWSKNLSVSSDDESEITLRPFFIPQKPRLEKIDPTHKQYQEIKSFFNKDIPTSKTREASRDGKTHVWVENQTDILVQWIGNEDAPRNFCKNNCRDAQVVFSGKEEITSVAFYKDRNDLLIASTNDIVFVIEVAKDEPQNFQPIYQGQNLTFGLPSNTTDPDLLFIRENQTIFATWI